MAFLDADDVWYATKLTKQVERILSDPELGLVHCGVEETEANGESRTLLDGMEGWVFEELLLFWRTVVIASGSTALVPRSTFGTVGGFDPRLSTAADWEFCYAIASRQRVGFVANL